MTKLAFMVNGPIYCDDRGDGGFVENENVCSDFKMLRVEVLKSMAIRSETFDFEVEVNAELCKPHYRLYEIPIKYTGRSFEEG